MKQTAEILFKYMKKIVKQIYKKKIGDKERYLQCILFSKIENRKLFYRKWSNADVEKVYGVVGNYLPCDQIFEENNLFSNNKAVWVEEKFLTPSGNASSASVIPSIMHDFARLLFLPKPNLKNYDVENYLAVIIKCGYNPKTNQYYDPRTYCAVNKSPKNDPENHPELSKLIYPPWKDEITFDVQEYFRHVIRSSGTIIKLLNNFPVLNTLKYINIVKYSYGTAPLDENAKPKELNGHVFGYLFKISL